LTHAESFLLHLRLNSTERPVVGRPLGQKFRPVSAALRRPMGPLYELEGTLQIAEESI